MDLVPIVCSQCGAPLAVPAGVNFVTCGHCHVALAVRRAPDVVYTEVPEKLDQKTDRLTEEVAQLRYRQAVNDLDHQWERKRQMLMIRGKDGSMHEPTEVGVWLTGIGTLVIGGLATCFAIGSGSVELGGVVLLVILLGGGGTFYAWHLHQAYQDAERAYRKRRQSLKVEDFLPRDE